MLKRWFILAVITAMAAACQLPAQTLPTPARMIFGTLQSDPARAADHVARGITLAQVGAIWSRFEPAEGQVDEAYVRSLRDQIQGFRQAGMAVMLDLGMQYPPRWVWDLPGARYVNQFGHRYDGEEKPGQNGVNAVFSAAVRQRQAAYVARIFQRLGSDFFAVRLGWCYYGELNYPPARHRQQRNCYWAFDEAAQGKTDGLPEGVKPCPAPGWIPGSASHDHASARAFAQWYLESLRNYHDWQIATVRKHYAGPLPMLMGSWGLRPGELEQAIRGDLADTGRAELPQGFDWGRFIAGVKDPNYVICCTWLDSKPEFGDDEGTDQARWSPAHFLAEAGKQHPLGLQTWGENTGRGDLAAMLLTFERVRRYEIRVLLWAFEPDLYNAQGRYATLADYARLIQATNDAPGR